MPKGDSFPMESRPRLSPQSGCRPLSAGKPAFLTLRPHSGGVNETTRACEQAVIPVADTILRGEERAKTAYEPAGQIPSGRVSCTALAAQQPASRTGANE